MKMFLLIVWGFLTGLLIVALVALLIWPFECDCTEEELQHVPLYAFIEHSGWIAFHTDITAVGYQRLKQISATLGSLSLGGSDACRVGAEIGASDDSAL